MEQAYGSQWPKAEHYPDPYLVPALDPVHASHFQSRLPWKHYHVNNTTKLWSQLSWPLPWNAWWQHFPTLQGTDGGTWRVSEFHPGRLEGELQRLLRGEAARPHRDVNVSCSHWSIGAKWELSLADSEWWEICCCCEASWLGRDIAAPPPTPPWPFWATWSWPYHSTSLKPTKLLKKKTSDNSSFHSRVNAYAAIFFMLEISDQRCCVIWPEQCGN